MAFPKGSGAAVIRRRRCRSAAPVGVFGLQDPVLFLFIIYLSHIPFINSIQKKAPRGLRPLPPVPGPFPLPSVLRPKMAPRRRPRRPKSAKMARHVAKWPPRWLHMAQDGPQEASKMAREASKTAQETPKTPPDGPQEAKNIENHMVFI